MNQPTDPSRPMPSSTPDPRPAVEAWLDTLGREVEAVERLDAALAQQLDALRARDQQAIEAATDAASQAVHDLGQLRRVGERQSRLVGRVLGLDNADRATLADALARQDSALGRQLRTALDGLRDRVKATQDRSQELAFALQLAVHIGQELLQTWQHLDAPASLQTYTAHGGPNAAPPPRSFVNHLG